MSFTGNPQDIIGATANDSSGSKIGTVGQLYLDDQSGEPEWVTLNTGLFGSSESFAPVAQASWDGQTLSLPYTKDQVKDAPRVGDDGHLSEQEEEALYRHYGMSDTYSSWQSSQSTTGTTTTSGRADTEDRAVGYDTSGPTTDDAITRSEERLHVGTERVQTGRAKLRKYVVGETVTETVPVTRETDRVEREPITDSNVGQAMDGPAIWEEEHEVVLSEERPVVAKETVPVERVRLTTDVETDNVQVNETVRKETVDLDAGSEAHRS